MPRKRLSPCDRRILRDIDPAQDVEIVRFQIFVAPLNHAVDDRGFPEGVAQAWPVIAENKRPWLWINRPRLVGRCPVACRDALRQLYLIVEREETLQPQASGGDGLRHDPRTCLSTGYSRCILFSCSRASAYTPSLLPAVVADTTHFFPHRR